MHCVEGLVGPWGGLEAATDMYDPCQRQVVYCSCENQWACPSAHSLLSETC
jgi:hypothetical protein